MVQTCSWAAILIRGCLSLGRWASRHKSGICYTVPWFPTLNDFCRSSGLPEKGVTVDAVNSSMITEYFSFRSGRGVVYSKVTDHSLIDSPEVYFNAVTDVPSRVLMLYFIGIASQCPHRAVDASLETFPDRYYLR